MIKLEIKGIIKEVFETKYQYPKYSGTFKKCKFLLESGGERYTLALIDKNIEYLKNCREGTEVITHSVLKGRNWSYKNKDYYVNEILCSSIEIIKNTNIIDYVEYDEKIFFVKKIIEDGILKLNLVSVKDNSEISICLNHRFPLKKFNSTHILISKETDKIIIDQLELIGIIINESYVKSGNNEGYICKVLVLDLFEEDNILYPEFHKVMNSPNSYEDINPRIVDEHYDQTDYSNFDENLDMDQQSDEFWNQF